MEVRATHFLVVATLLSYLMPGLLVVAVVPDRSSPGFIWTISVYFLVASCLYVGTLLRFFCQRRRARNQQPLSPPKRNNATSYLDCPPSYAEVTETPPPYYLLPKMFQRSSSRLKKDLQLSPQASFLPRSSSTFKRIVFRSKSLMTNSTHSNYSSLESSSKLVIPLQLMQNQAEFIHGGSSSSEEHQLGDPISTDSSSPELQSPPLNAEHSISEDRLRICPALSTESRVKARRISLGLRSTMSCPLSHSSISTVGTRTARNFNTQQ